MKVKDIPVIPWFFYIRTSRSKRVNGLSFQLFKRVVRFGGLLIIDKDNGVGSLTIALTIYKLRTQAELAWGM